MLRSNLRRALKPTLNRFMGGGGSPVFNYVARLDGLGGLGQYWQINPTIVAPALSELEINIGFYIPTTPARSNWECLMAGNGIVVTASKRGGAVPYGIYISVGGVAYDLDLTWGYDVYQVVTIGSDDLGNWYVGLNGSVKNFTSSEGFQIERLGRDGIVGGDDYLTGYVKDFSIYIGGTAFSEIPLTNKDQGATQLATVGSVNATMINYTEDVWEIENQPPQNNQQASFQQAKAGEESEVNEGSWSGNEPITYAYQWQLDGVDIVGATAKTLLVIAGMIGQSLRCVVTATNQYGSGISITAAIVVTI